MSNKTRKALWPIALVLAVVAIGAMALVMGFAGGSGTAQAHSPGNDHDATSCETERTANIHDALPGPDCLAAPTGVDGTATMNSITLMWDAVADAESYIVEYKTGSNAYGNPTTVTATTTTVSGLTEATTYTFRVRATSAAAGEGRWAEATITTPGLVDPPMNVSVAHDGQATQLTVSWEASPSEDVIGYEITYRALPNGRMMMVEERQTSPHTIEDLEPSTEYQVCVIAVAEDEDGEEIKSAPECGNATTSRYVLTFDDGQGGPNRNNAQNYVIGVSPGGEVTVRATVWVPEPIASGDDTDTVAVRFMSDPEDLVVTTANLLAVSDNSIDDGELTIRPRDLDKRSFQVSFECVKNPTVLIVSIYDDNVQKVEEGKITVNCGPAAPVVPDTDRFRSDVMTVVSYNDWDHWDRYKTVSDGFIIVDNDTDKNVRHQVNQTHHKDGILVRDEPVVESYQLAISPTEILTLKAGADPDRLTKAEAEEGQHTIEVMMDADYVQLTVTSTMEGPAYIRFLDSDMEPFGTDVDEDPRWAGADVVGLDSQGHLALNLTRALTAAQALAYDQYRVVIPGAAAEYAYLAGLPSASQKDADGNDVLDDDGEVVRIKDYHQGAFRFMNPCPRELGSDHHFYVEVYEANGKYHKTTEKVMCVVSPRPGPAGLEFGIDSDKPGEGRLTFKPARNAVGHTVLLIDAHNRNIVTSVTATPAMYNSTTNEYTVMFNNLNNGWTYHIVVLAQGAANQFTADAVKDYGVRWLGRADVALSTTPSATPTRQHNLCKVDNTAITALLSDCAAASTELGMPTGVTANAVSRDGDPGIQDIVVMWTDGVNADRHVVFLFTSDATLVTVNSAQTDGNTTFMNVASGTYSVVVVAVKNGPTGNAADIEMYTVAVTVN